MTIQDRAAKVLQEIDAALALAEKATAGPWQCLESRGGSSMGEYEILYYDGQRYNRLGYLSPENEINNATFIAASRTLLPKLAEGLKTAIKGLEAAHVASPDGDDTAWNALAAILDQWGTK